MQGAGCQTPCSLHILRLTGEWVEDWYLIAEQQGYSSPKEMWHNLYTVQGLSLDEIAARLKVTDQCIRYNLIKWQIVLRDKGGAHNRTLLCVEARENPELLKKSVQYLCREYGVSKWTVYSLRRQLLKE